MELSTQHKQRLHQRIGEAIERVYQAELTDHAPALNIMPCHEFPCTERRLSPGDLFFACTDGVVEKRSETGEFFGKQRLLETIRAQKEQDLKTIRQSILHRLRSFGSSPAADDDIALILLKRYPASGV